MSERTAAIIGLGLIGGSLARDLTTRGIRVVGGDRDADAVAAALDAGVIAAGLGPALDGLDGVDWIVLAVPVDRVSALLQRVGRRRARPRLVMDVASTKRAIMALAARSPLAARFVGAHPLGGDHRSGWGASRVGLFTGRPVFLCRTRSTADDAVAEARRLWNACGASPSLTDAREHDRQMGLISHLPQLVASALALELSAAGVNGKALGPGGDDMTRLAASSPELWTGIALANSRYLAPALRRHERAVARLRRAVERGDAPALRRMLRVAHTWASS